MAVHGSSEANLSAAAAGRAIATAGQASATKAAAGHTATLPSQDSWLRVRQVGAVVAAATHSASQPAKPKVTTLSCSGTSPMLPENYQAIVNFMIQHGYTRMAAAGMAGNMFQESRGNPESVGTGGGGLIGFTPLPAGYVTGNPAADLHNQLEDVLVYNQQWAQYIPALNAATTPTQAADVYMNYFERPGLPAAYNREAAANAVASACGF